MYVTDESERSLGAFVLISLILHALLIFLYPEWQLATGPGMLFGGNGGIITIIPIDDQPSARAQLSRQPADGVRREETKKPATETPVPQPEKQVVEAEVKPEPQVEQPVPKESSTPIESQTPATVEEKAAPAPEPQEQVLEPADDTEKNLADSGSDNDTLLTSEQGQDVVVSGGGSPDAAGGEPAAGPSVDPDLLEEVEPSPPPLPPLPAAGSIVAGGGRVQYPKNAINEGLAGTVKLDAYVPKGATKANRIVIRESSGLDTLDQVASLTIEHGWKMEPLLEDYVLSVTIVFGGPPEFRVRIEYDGIRYVKDE